MTLRDEVVLHYVHGEECSLYVIITIISVLFPMKIIMVIFSLLPESMLTRLICVRQSVPAREMIDYCICIVTSQTQR